MGKMKNWRKIGDRAASGRKFRARNHQGVQVRFPNQPSDLLVSLMSRAGITLNVESTTKVQTA